MKFSKYIIAGGLALALGLSSCVDDLNVDPENPTTKTALEEQTAVGAGKDAQIVGLSGEVPA